MTKNLYVGREVLLQKEKTGNASALWVTVLTLANIILYAIGADIGFTICAYLPLMFGVIGVEMIKNPGTFIEGTDVIMDTQVLSFMGILLIALAIIGIGLYFLCWILGKKHFGWRIVALVLFGIDTVIVLLSLIGGDISFIIDVIFHAFIIYEMIAGISAHGKLKTIPEEELPEETQDVSASEQ